MTRFPQMRAGLFLDPGALPAATCDEMRKAIYEGERDSAVIHNAMYAADINGMSAEDRYVMLAYHALITLEKQFQQVLRFTDLMPNVPHIEVPAIYRRSTPASQYQCPQCGQLGFRTAKYSFDICTDCANNERFPTLTGES